MSADTTGAALAAVLDALTLVQGQLDAVVRGNARVEAVQRDIVQRLDTIDAGQAAVTDLIPILETILARAIEDRELVGSRLAAVAEVAAFAHAAASGSPATLPDELADNPLLERFALRQPADIRSPDRALATWRSVASDVGTGDLKVLLAGQYAPSATDVPASRVLRYRLAAITRMEIEGRGVTPPDAPASTTADDRSTEAKRARSLHLARLWRAGESAALYADPELAGSLDLFASAERSRKEGEQLTVALAAVHRRIGDMLEEGGRPTLADAAVLLGEGRTTCSTDRPDGQARTEPDR